MAISKNYHVYIVECVDGTFYIGCTTDLERRVQEHNESWKGAAYTRGRRPVTLKYFELLPNRSKALIREAELKRLTREQKKALIEEGP